MVFDVPGPAVRSSKPRSPTIWIWAVPKQIELIFGRKILPSTPGVFATRDGMATRARIPAEALGRLPTRRSSG
jgi:hypothetical protein